MSGAIVRNDSKAPLEEGHELIVPVVRTQRPAVVEDDRRGVLWPPILVEDVGVVLGRDEGHGHALRHESGVDGQRDRRRTRCYRRAGCRSYVEPRESLATM